MFSKKKLAPSSALNRFYVEQKQTKLSEKIKSSFE